MKRCLAIAASIAVAACGSSSLIHTALYGDLGTLKRELAAEQRRGELDRDSVQDLAAAVAAREIRSSQGSAGVQRVRRVRACAGSLLPVLRARAERSDAAGAEATLLLYERGQLSAGPLVARYASAHDGAWRAVAARASARADYGGLRRSLMRDVDERARRAALQAAIELADPDDLHDVLEAARLDPDPHARALAARAAGSIGGEEAVLALADLWPRASPTARLAIVEAWSQPRAYRAGGRQRLVGVAESMSGMPAIAAAEALLRKDVAAAELGTAVLARAIREGTTAERQAAITAAPFSDTDVRTAVHAAARDRDPVVRVAALARLTRNSATRSAAINELRREANSRDSSAVQARAALAAQGDPSVRPQLIAQLAERSPKSRESAALSLLALGEYRHAATALADDDPDVRTEVACSVLAAE